MADLRAMASGFVPASSVQRSYLDVPPEPPRRQSLGAAARTDAMDSGASSSSTSTSSASTSGGGSGSALRGAAAGTPSPHKRRMAQSARDAADDGGGAGMGDAEDWGLGPVRAVGAGAGRGTRTLVPIAVAEYDDSFIPNRAMVPAEVTKMGRMMRSGHMFRVQEPPTTRAPAILRHLATLAAAAKEGDLLCVYFSAHFATYQHKYGCVLTSESTAQGVGGSVHASWTSVADVLAQEWACIPLSALAPIVHESKATFWIIFDGAGMTGKAVRTLTTAVDDRARLHVYCASSTGAVTAPGALATRRKGKAASVVQSVGASAYSSVFGHAFATALDGGVFTGLHTERVSLRQLGQWVRSRVMMATQQKQAPLVYSHSERPTLLSPVPDLGALCVSTAVGGPSRAPKHARGGEVSALEDSERDEATVLGMVDTSLTPVQLPSWIVVETRWRRELPTVMERLEAKAMESEERRALCQVMARDCEWMLARTNTRQPMHVFSRTPLAHPLHGGASDDECARVLIDCGQRVHVARLTPHNHVLALGHDGTLVLSDGTDTVRTPRAESGSVVHGGASADGRIVACASDARVQVWCTRSDGADARVEESALRIVSVSAPMPSAVSCVAVDVCGEVVAAGCWTGEVVAMRSESECVWFGGDVAVRTRVAALCCTSDGTVAHAYDSSPVVHVWSAAQPQGLQKLHGHREWVSALCVSPDGAVIVSCDAGGNMCVWRCVEHGGEWAIFKSLSSPYGGISCVHSSRDGALVVCGTRSGHVLVWDVLNGELLATSRIEASGGAIESVGFDTSGDKLVCAGASGVVVEWKHRMWRAHMEQLPRARTGDTLMPFVDVAQRGVRYGLGERVGTEWVVGSKTVIGTQERVVMMLKNDSSMPVYVSVYAEAIRDRDRDSSGGGGGGGGAVSPGGSSKAGGREGDDNAAPFDERIASAAAWPSLLTHSPVRVDVGSSVLLRVPRRVANVTGVLRLSALTSSFPHWNIMPAHEAAQEEGDLWWGVVECTLHVRARTPLYNMPSENPRERDLRHLALLLHLRATLLQNKSSCLGSSHFGIAAIHPRVFPPAGGVMLLRVRGVGAGAYTSSQGVRVSIGERAQQVWAEDVRVFMHGDEEWLVQCVVPPGGGEQHPVGVWLGARCTASPSMWMSYRAHMSDVRADDAFSSGLTPLAWMCSRHTLLPRSAGGERGLTSVHGAPDALLGYACSGVARQWLEQQLATLPDVGEETHAERAHVLYRLGVLSRSGDESEEALRRAMPWLRASLQSMPHERTLYELAVCVALTAGWDEPDVGDLLRNALLLNPHHMASLKMLAVLHARLGHMAEACTHVRAVMRMLAFSGVAGRPWSAPTDVLASDGEAALPTLASPHQTAALLSPSACRMLGHDPAWHTFAMWVCAKNNLLEEACVYGRRAVSMSMRSTCPPLVRRNEYTALLCAEVHAHVGHSRQALHFLRLAAAPYTRALSARGAARERSLCVLRGDLQCAAGDFAAALAAYHAALAMSDDVVVLVKAGRAHKALAKAVVSSGQSDAFDTMVDNIAHALKCFQRAVAHLRAVQPPSREAGELLREIEHEMVVVRCVHVGALAHFRNTRVLDVGEARALLGDTAAESVSAAARVGDVGWAMRHPVHTLAFYQQLEGVVDMAHGFRAAQMVPHAWTVINLGMLMLRRVDDREGDEHLNTLFALPHLYPHLKRLYARIQLEQAELLLHECEYASNAASALSLAEKTARALELVEATKAQHQRDVAALLARVGDMDGGRLSTLVEACERAGREMDAYRAMLFSHVGHGFDAALLLDHGTAYHAAAERIRALLRGCDARLREEGGLAWRMTSAVTYADMVARVASPERAVVSWFVGRNHIFAFVVTAGSRAPKVIACSHRNRDQLVAWMASYRKAYASSKTHSLSQWRRKLPAQLHQLARMLEWDAVLHALQAHRDVTFVPHGGLGAFPLHALPHPETGACTLEHFSSVEYWHTCHAVSTWAGGTGGAGEGDVLYALSDPASDLPYSVLECFSLAHCMGFARTFQRTRDAAHAAQVRADQHAGVMHRADALHIASHGSSELAGRGPAHITLARGSTLGVSDLLGWRAVAKVAMLSTCDSGTRTGEHVTLPEALLLGGCKWVLANAWAVNDVSALLLTLRFYDVLRADACDASTALCSAQRWLRQVTLAELQQWLSDTHRRIAHVLRTRDAAGLPTSEASRALHQLEEVVRTLQASGAEHEMHAPSTEQVCVFAHPFYWAPMAVLSRAPLVQAPSGDAPAVQVDGDDGMGAFAVVRADHDTFQSPSHTPTARPGDDVMDDEWQFVGVDVRADSDVRFDVALPRHTLVVLFRSRAARRSDEDPIALVKVHTSSLVACRGHVLEAWCDDVRGACVGVEVGGAGDLLWRVALDTEACDDASAAHMMQHTLAHTRELGVLSAVSDVADAHVVLFVSDKRWHAVWQRDVLGLGREGRAVLAPVGGGPGALACVLGALQTYAFALNLLRVADVDTRALQVNAHLVKNGEVCDPAQGAPVVAHTQVHRRDGQWVVAQRGDVLVVRADNHETAPVMCSVLKIDADASITVHAQPQMVMEGMFMQTGATFVQAPGNAPLPAWCRTDVDTRLTRASYVVLATDAATLDVAQLTQDGLRADTSSAHPRPLSLLRWLCVVGRVHTARVRIVLRDAWVSERR